MRLLFVSSTTIGGSGRSQRELAVQLERLGHQVRFVADDGRRSAVVRFMYGQLSDLSVRLEGGRLGQLAKWVGGLPGSRARCEQREGLAHQLSPVPQNAIRSVIRDFQPDIVIGNSLERWAWRRVYDVCQRHSVPSVLYLREVDSLDHMATGAIPDVIVANAESLAQAVRDRGFQCAFVPSVIDLDVTRTESTRQVALTINPIASKGGDLVWELATRLPHIRFVTQESWPLAGVELAEAQEHAARLDNVEFRRSSPPGPALYGDARVLLVPYRVDSRPRVIAEAQASGIPVIAADVPALVEAIGPGGVCVGLDDIDAWCSAVETMWSDEDHYEALSSAAAEHGARDEIDPRWVARSFEAIVARLVDDAQS